MYNIAIKNLRSNHQGKITNDYIVREMNRLTTVNGYEDYNALIKALQPGMILKTENTPKKANKPIENPKEKIILK